MKAIAAQGKLPFNIGGFCVTAANINGELKYNLNIFNQRSSCVYDLIDTDFNVYRFVTITSYDKDKIRLDASKTALEIAPTLAKNTFCIKIDDSAFAESFQFHKIKLSTGAMKYHPWDLYYCNLPG
ncbi:hypothetical protein [Escherichia coli]|uniref:Uncharacterized protein n=4 Tax=Asteriusvirus PBECO4 TaxID=2560463 RepID=A0A1C3S6X5_9CAUD|nr:hypothetical protein [Escherichia coli]YP_009150412.1 virion structural protein [Escherichia phage PBECO4]AXC36899.1 putative structural protein [Escherichia phage UB]MED6536371.1 hypothetical protein [Escherichia coli O157]QBO61943.1 hypothetical protein G17_00454 [Escherichia phage vB_EcoM_G17]QDF13971.1 hypothetical protein vBEcoMphAPEC6_gp347 [Escherichia phage vB_EcoM_phAPEC6]QXN76188.1 structural protein [Escherichia phage BF17]WIL00723.1 putative Sir2-like protein [Escherichia phag